jgi:hypothetical protein
MTQVERLPMKFGVRGDRTGFPLVTTSHNPESVANRCGVRRSSIRLFRFCF